MSDTDRCQDRSWQDKLDRALTAEGAAHLQQCSACARRARDVEWAAAVTSAEIPPAPAHLEQRILDAASRERPRRRQRAETQRDGGRYGRAGLRRHPRLAMLGVGTVLGAVVTGALAGGGSVGHTPSAQASDVFSRKCPAAPEPATPVQPGGRSLEGEKIVVAGVWQGKEAAHFKAVLRRFEQETGASVEYQFAQRDIARTIRVRLHRDCPPDIAMLPQPGVLNGLVRNHALAPLDDTVGDRLQSNYSPAWRGMARVRGKSYGVWFKTAHKSNLWYSRSALRRVGAAPPKTWQEMQAVAARLSERQSATGIAPFSIAGDDGWTLTDWFENVYLRIAGPTRYTQLATGKIPWTHPTIRRALLKLAEIFTRPEWMAGGTKGALKTSFTASVDAVFGPSANAAMMSEGDFVLTEVAPGAIGDVGVTPFPSIDGSKQSVVAAGDLAVLFNKNAHKPAAQELMRYFATPEAAAPWVRSGGFISPNRRLALQTYLDPTMRELARELTEAPTVRFDLSDLQPPAFGARDAQGMWLLLQNFLEDPSAIDATTKKLQLASTAAAVCEDQNSGECS